MRLWSLVLGCLLAAHAAAQASFVVDASGGAGSQFLDIQAAVQAVPSGSVLLVRPGSYSPVVIDGKGLVVLCDPGAVIAPPAFYADGPFLSILDTQPGQVVAVSGLGFGPIGAQFHDGILVSGAEGLVVVDGRGSIVEPYAPPIAGIGATLKIADSSQVVIRDFVLRGGAQDNPGSAPFPQLAGLVVNSSVVFERCVLSGSDTVVRGHVARPGKSALSVTDSRVDLVETTVVGGNGWSTTQWFLPPGPIQFPAEAAVTSSNSQWVVRGSAQQAVAGGVLPAAGAALPAATLDAVVGSGSARIDSAIPVFGAVSGGMQITVGSQLRLTSNMPVLGGVASATCHAPSGSSVAVALGLPAPASTIPGLADPVWLGGNFGVAFGSAGVGGLFSVGFPVPSVPAVRGVPFVWQAAEIGPAGIVALSNPSVAQVR